MRLGNAEAVETLKAQIGEANPDGDWVRNVVKAMLTIPVEKELRSASDEYSVVSNLRHLSDLCRRLLYRQAVLSCKQNPSCTFHLRVQTLLDFHFSLGKSLVIQLLR